MPDGVPHVRLFTPAGVVQTTFDIPTLDRYGTTGLFQLLLPVSAFFGIRGNWRVVYSYYIGTYSGIEEDTFEVLGGGNQNANVISMTYYRRPDADYIVYQTDSGGALIAGYAGNGVILAGRNPRI